MARILVADDDPKLRAFAAELLTADGHVVAVAADGIEARDRLAADRFDLLLSNVSMPGLGGPQLVAGLRARGSFVPIVLMSGIILSPLALDGIAFLHKPFSVDELLDRVQDALRPVA